MRIVDISLLHNTFILLKSARGGIINPFYRPKGGNKPVKTHYAIKVYKEYFNFSSGHFLVFSDGTREPLHGHNYRVSVKGQAPQLQSDMVFDFLDLKPIVKQACDRLDHRVIIPDANPHLKIEISERSVILNTLDGSQFNLPREDVLILPLPNTSAERLAIYLAQEIYRLVLDRFKFKFKNLEVEVEESPGQSAIYLLEEGEIST